MGRNAHRDGLEARGGPAPCLQADAHGSFRAYQVVLGVPGLFARTRSFLSTRYARFHFLLHERWEETHTGTDWRRGAARHRASRPTRMGRSGRTRPFRAYQVVSFDQVRAIPLPTARAMGRNARRDGLEARGGPAPRLQADARGSFRAYQAVPRVPGRFARTRSIRAYRVISFDQVRAIPLPTARAMGRNARARERRHPRRRVTSGMSLRFGSYSSEPAARIWRRSSRRSRWTSGSGRGTAAMSRCVYGSCGSRRIWSRVPTSAR
ncbi:hypothetical protein EDF64_101249 [Curtobacterium flaccumfaciens]|uniref:Uncharacterized protein n=1 Tax=Curtobacterium flaccumfaciens TaxID=2035 RepID=A0A4R6DN44_9MICO|nr:hypothetical protein EDF64_101249 [Curtobacterium flaccumfaciens]